MVCLEEEEVPVGQVTETGDGGLSCLLSIIGFVEDVDEDLDNLDVNNTSEKAVLDANYISSYNRVPVFKLPIGKNAFSYGVIFVGPDIDGIDIKHEHGHSLQYQEIGIKKYTKYVAIPSLYGCWIKPIGTNHYYSQPWEYGADLYGRISFNSRNYDTNVQQRYYSYWNMVLNSR